MTEYTVSKTYSFPHITVCDRITDGVHMGWQVYADRGYVMCAPDEHNTEIDPETGVEREVTYYYTVKVLPPRFDFSKFPWVAVPVSEADEDNIFGSLNAEGFHEITKEEYDAILAQQEAIGTE